VPVFTFQNKTCLFVHIPKAAGTAFENALVENGWTKHFSVNGLSPERVSFMKVTPQHFHARLLEAVFHFEAFDEIIVIVRDPVARMKSEFYWQEASGQTNLAAETWIEDAFDSYAADPGCFDNHLRPQTEFIPSTGPVRVFKLEDNGVSGALDAVLSHSRQSLPKRMFKKGLRSRKRSKMSSYRPDVEAVFAKRSPDIRTFYSHDCEELGYSVR